MSACVSETLRKYPPLNRLERRCSKAGYKVGGIELEADQLVEIPTYALHYNPEVLLVLFSIFGYHLPYFSITQLLVLP